MDDCFGPVGLKALPEFLQDDGTVLIAFHIDHIYENDSAEIAKPDLPDDFRTCYEVVFKHGPVDLFAAACKLLCIDIDDT